MGKRLTLWTILASLLILITAAQTWAGETDRPRLISDNLPLNSYVEGYLEKLSGLGYLDDILDGTRPYSRIRVARWVRQIVANVANDSTAPTYVRNMAAELETEFAKELLALDSEENQYGFSLRRLSWGTAYDDGPVLEQRQTASHYQPLNINQNGYNLEEGFNETLSLAAEVNLGNWLLLNVTPRLDYHNQDHSAFNFESAYLKTRLGNIEVLYGKDAVAWGEGQRGCLLFSGNSTPQTIFKLSTVDPVECSGIFGFLGQSTAAFFYSAPESKRGDVKNANLTGLRLSFRPSPNFTFAFAGGSILGGDGHEVHWGDIGDLIRGKNTGDPASEKWDSIAGVDFCWRLPSIRNLEIYGEYYGEDEAGKYLPLPSKNAYLFGFFLPKLNKQGDWDLRFETARTTAVWYGHFLYRDGFTYRDEILGDAMGNNATRYYLNLTHYFDGANLGINFERIIMDNDAENPQNVNSLWLAYHRQIGGGLELEAATGCAKVENLGFTEDKCDINYLVSIGLTRLF